MKKNILIFLILIGFLLFPCCSFADMETKSLTIGGNNNEEESSIQTILKHEVESPAQEQQAVPVEVINNYIDVTPPYNYYPYPYTSYYTRTIGPYGVYTNTGGFSFNYQGHSFSYGGGFNQPIYVGPPIPPPHVKPPHNQGSKPPHSGNRPPSGAGRPSPK